MATELQKRANRQNSLKSTGPRSLAGKAVSSRNAVKHGLTSRLPLLPGENEDEFNEFRLAIFGDQRPQGVVESQIVERIVGLLWRLRRVPVFEAALYEWVAHLEAEAHDPLTEETAAGTNVTIITTVPTSDRDAEDAREDLGTRLKLGRMLEAALSHDVISKFSRYERDLSRELARSLAELRALRANRPEFPKTKKGADDTEDLPPPRSYPAYGPDGKIGPP